MTTGHAISREAGWGVDAGKQGESGVDQRDTEVARALGYRGHSSVNAALARVASSNRQLLVVLNGLVEGFTND